MPVCGTQVPWNNTYKIANGTKKIITTGTSFMQKQQFKICVYVLNKLIYFNACI